MKVLNTNLAGGGIDTLAVRMRKSRLHAQVTIKRAAQLIGLSEGQLGRIERGGVCMVSDPATMVRAGRAYGVSDVWLYAGGLAPARLVPEWYAVAAA